MTNKHHDMNCFESIQRVMPKVTPTQEPPVTLNIETDISDIVNTTEIISLDPLGLSTHPIFDDPLELCIYMSPKDGDRLDMIRKDSMPYLKPLQDKVLEVLKYDNPILFDKTAWNCPYTLHAALYLGYSNGELLLYSDDALFGPYNGQGKREGGLLDKTLVRIAMYNRTTPGMTSTDRMHNISKLLDAGFLRDTIVKIIRKDFFSLYDTPSRVTNLVTGESRMPW